MNFTTVWEENVFIVSFSGAINTVDIELANKYFYEDKRAYKVAAAIWDLSDCNMENIKPDKLAFTEAVDLAGAAFIKVFRLALVTSDKHSVALCNKYIHSCLENGSPWEFKIFNSAHDAFEWVNA